jgi:hypothetical protein
VPRTEGAFDDHVRLLGQLALLVEDSPGDVVEIAVRKGNSLLLINEVCSRERRIIRMIPCELRNQFDEFSGFQENIFRTPWY